MGRLIVFEGIDGSGKSTQFKMLCERLLGEGVDFRRLVFPQYSEPSSALIRMYLGGEFGSKPGDVNAYAASAFYAVDRFASYNKLWKDYYLAGGLMLADRYTTSNAIHQASKLPQEEYGAFFDWLEDFEYRLMGLPKPDMVLYMDIPAELAVRQLRQRENATHTSADIHEKDAQYLKQCAVCAVAAAEHYGWKRIRCTDGKEMLPMESIHSEIYSLVKGVL